MPVTLYDRMQRDIVLTKLSQEEKAALGKRLIALREGKPDPTKTSTDLMYEALSKAAAEGDAKGRAYAAKVHGRSTYTAKDTAEQNAVKVTAGSRQAGTSGEAKKDPTLPFWYVLIFLTYVSPIALLVVFWNQFVQLIGMHFSSGIIADFLRWLTFGWLFPYS